jgi:hypothetical protein
MGEYKQFDDGMTRMTVIIASVGLVVLMLGAVAKAASLHAAIHAVENPRDLHTNHAAQGPMQIQPPLVRDLDRHGYRFTLADRFSWAKSCRMFDAYRKLYHARSEEQASRLWNQGPGGMWNRAAGRYWRNVRRHLHRRSR